MPSLRQGIGKNNLIWRGKIAPRKLTADCSPAGRIRDNLSGTAYIYAGAAQVNISLTEADKKEKETLRIFSGKSDLPTLLVKISGKQGIDASAIGSGGRKRDVVRARKLLIQIAVCRMGYSGA